MTDLTPDARNSRARPPAAGGIGLYCAIAIGIGGMVGAGIFSILGVVAQAAGDGMWICFMMGSGAFLLIYAGVNAAHLKIIAATGAKKWLVWLALIACLIMLGVLSCYIYQNSKPALITMIGLLPLCFGLEWAYRTRTGRIIKPRIL